MMRTGWRTTPHGEWVLDHVGLVALVEGRGWYGYPFRPGLPRGPFTSMELAMDGLENMLASRIEDGGDFLKSAGKVAAK
jgi:hypothetical protein